MIPMWIVPLAYAMALLTLLAMVAVLYLGGALALLIVDLIRNHKKD